MMKILRIASKGLAVIAAGAAILLGASFGPTLIGYESFIVVSGSMGKANPVGSVAVTRMVDTKSIREGDVVSFQIGSTTPITHRVIEVTEEEGQRVFTTKGDANLEADPEPLRLTSGRIARVEWSVPYAGYLVRYARTPIGGFVFFVIPILGLILGKRSKKSSSLADSTDNNRHSPLTSLLELACPNCQEGLAVRLVSLRDVNPNIQQPQVTKQPSRDRIVIPETTSPELEVVSIQDARDIKVGQLSAKTDKPEWNFSLQLSGAEPHEGGSRYA